MKKVKPSREQLISDLEKYEGMVAKDVAAIYGVTASSLHRWVREYGLTVKWAKPEVWNKGLTKADERIQRAVDASVAVRKGVKYTGARLEKQQEILHKARNTPQWRMAMAEQGERNRGRPIPPEQRIKISESVAKSVLRGPDHHWYKHGRGSDSRRAEANKQPYKNWRRQVFIRDNYTCQDCDKRGGDLNAHHIKSWVDHEELRYDVDNGVTLCVPCHRDRHR